ncbi:BOS complex subunit NCLN [Hetaerina americana]|uniref:BOS complex subunit NCLN n=1 Tax=Hetaerina americana TaxID=62018 RepID=UPI003A7F19E0
MWFEADEFAEIFKGYFPYYLIIALPIFIIISPVNPVTAAHEFPAYRMQHFDLHGVPHGCRSAPVSLEARPLQSWGSSAPSSQRHCLVAPIASVSSQLLRDALGGGGTIIAPKAGALLLMLPPKGSLTAEDKQKILETEEALLWVHASIPIPIYFAYHSPQLVSIIEDISSSFLVDSRPRSALQALLNSVSANGYQVSVSSGQASPMTNVFVSNIQGKLPGYGLEDKLPTIAIVAHYDSFGVAPELSFGADSNASGVALLLELARLFSHLYSHPRSHPHVNLLFLLSSAGKFNFQGSKRWLEDHLDASDSTMLQDSMFVLCLDSLGSMSSNHNHTLYMHVSKPPKEGSPAAQFYQILKGVSQKMYPGAMSVDLIHKKINLAEESLAWEHERHSIRRLPAFTLSNFQSHKDPKRSTILDSKEWMGSRNGETLLKNARVITEALTLVMYNLSTEHQIFSNSLGVEPSSLEAWVDYLSSQPRSAQLLASKQNPLVLTLQDAMSRYTKEVKVTYLSPDKRDPEFVFYDVSKVVVNVYSVKPAVFDLFLTIAILGYLAAIYALIQNFPLVYSAVSKLSFGSKVKVH